MIVIPHTESKYDLCGPFLIVHDGVVLSEHDVVLENQHLALFELTYVMVLPVVLSEHVLVTVNLVLWQVGLLFASLDLLAELAADIAEVMLTAVVDV